MDNEELNSLLTTIKNQGEEIEAKDKEIAKLRKELDKNAKAKTKSDEVKPAAKKTTAKKAASKK